MELHLLRHAHAGDPDAWGGPDAARPLSPRGREQAEALAAHLASIGFMTDVILTSPKVRARETADIVADRFGWTVEIEERLVGGEADVDTIEAILSDAGNPDRALLVGHDPEFSDILADLIGTDTVPMRKGAMARIEVDRPVEPGGGTLRWLLPPDAVRPAR